MMNKEFWTLRIREMLMELADADYQRRVWLGHSSSEVSSFAEAASQLCNDYDLNGLINAHLGEFKNASEIAQAFAALRRSLDAVDASQREAELISSPEMELVRSVAKKALSLLNEGT